MHKDDDVYKVNVQGEELELLIKNIALLETSIFQTRFQIANDKMCDARSKDFISESKQHFNEVNAYIKFLRSAELIEQNEFDDFVKDLKAQEKGLALVNRYEPLMKMMLDAKVILLELEIVNNILNSACGNSLKDVAYTIWNSLPSKQTDPLNIKYRAIVECNPDPVILKLWL